MQYVLVLIALRFALIASLIGENQELTLSRRKVIKSAWHHGKLAACLLTDRREFWEFKCHIQVLCACEMRPGTFWDVLGTTWYIGSSRFQRLDYLVIYIYRIICAWFLGKICFCFYKVTPYGYTIQRIIIFLSISISLSISLETFAINCSFFAKRVDTEEKLWHLLGNQYWMVVERIVNYSLMKFFATDTVIL